MKNKVLVLGANGQLGTALRKTFAEATFADRETFDISDVSSYANWDWSNYNVLINAAAMTNVDGAESADGRKLAWQLNATAVGHMSVFARENEITLVHISSDYVFDGTKPIHSEIEPFSPLGVYGQTKAAGDIAASLSPKHYIVRTGWVIGEGHNFVRTMKSLAEKDVKPSVVNDQIGRLTFTIDLATGIKHLLENNASYGTYNLTNDGDSVSWADIAADVYELSGHDRSAVTGVTTSEYYEGKEGIAPRPLQSTLNLDKIKATGFTPRNWKQALHDYLEQE